MSVFDRLVFRRQRRESDQPIAYEIHFSGEGVYPKKLNESFAVVFEDTEGTGYFYAADASQTEIFDSLHLYDPGKGLNLRPNEAVFVVWNPFRMRVGLYFHDCFQAIFDFASHRGVCRTGFPHPSGRWSANGHAWDERLTEGLRRS